MKYIGFLPDKTAIIKDSLEELNNVPHIEYILKENLPEGWPATKGWPKYYLINPDGTNRTITIGNYEVIDIDYLDAKYNRGRVATIMEINTKQSHTFRQMIGSHDFLTKELLPLLDELNQFGNLKRFLKFKYNEEQLKLLEARLVEKNNIISELTTKLEAYEGKKEA